MQTNLTWNLILVDDESMDGNGNLYGCRFRRLGTVGFTRKVI